MSGSRFAFLYSPTAYGSHRKPLDFSNLEGCPTGLTGTDLICVSYARELSKRGHSVDLYCDRGKGSFDGVQVLDWEEWNGLGYDVAIATSNPNALKLCSPGTIRLVNRQVSTFGLGLDTDENFADYVDVIMCPSKTAVDVVSKPLPPEVRRKFRVLPNGCYPEQYGGVERIPGRVVYASSPDRGLHWLLRCWPAIRKAVPHATLRVFYQALDRWLDERCRDVWAGTEEWQRAHYVRWALERLKDHGVERVDGTGGVSHRQIGIELQRAEVLAYPADPMAYCVTGDTLVDTERGLLRIDEMTDVRCRTASLDGKYAAVSNWVDSGVQDTKRIRTRLGLTVAGTPNHPLLVLNEHLEYEWRQLGDIKVGDRVCVNRAPGIFPGQEPDLRGFVYPKPSRGHMPKEAKLPDSMSPELARLLGYLVAEAYIHPKKIMFSNNDEDVLKDFRECFARCFPDTRLHEFPVDPARWGHIGKPFVKLEIHSHHVIRFLHHKCGLDPVKADLKSVPSAILRSTKASVAAFIAAYFEGDGGMIVGGIRAQSKSRRLLAEVQLLLLRFGIVSYIGSRPSVDMFLLSITSRPEVERFASAIDFLSTRKRLALRQIEAKGKAQGDIDKIPYVQEFGDAVLDKRRIRRGGGFAKRGLYMDDEGNKVECSRGDDLGLHRSSGSRPWARGLARRIAKVSKSAGERLEFVCDAPYVYDEVLDASDAGRQHVYDITVPGTHAFTGNGIICHNTETFSVAILEACAAGCVPVICGADSIGEVHGRACPTVQPPMAARVDEFTQLVIRGLTDRQFQADVRKKTLAHAQAHAWPLLTDRLERIIAEAKDAKRAPAVSLERPRFDFVLTEYAAGPSAIDLGDRMGESMSGGCREGFLGLVKAMPERGYDVRAYSMFPRAEERDGVRYFPISEFAQASPRDALLAYYDTSPLIGVAPGSCLRISSHHTFRPPAHAIEWTDLHVAPSQYTVDVMRPVYDMNVPWYVLPNAVPDGMPEWRPVAGRCIYHTSVSRGLHHLLEMWPEIRAKVPHATLHVVGDIAGWVANVSGYETRQGIVARRVAAGIETARKAGGLEMLGRLPRRTLLRELSEASCAPMPFDVVGPTETWSVSIQECLAIGVPVVMIPCDALESLWGDAVSMVDTPSEMVHMVANVLLDAEFARGLSEDGRTVGRQYTFANAAKALDEIVRKHLPVRAAMKEAAE